MSLCSMHQFKGPNVALPIKDLLQSFVDKKRDWKVDLLYKWRDIIGSLHDKVRIEKIHNDTLILGVFHPCWMQELYLLSPLLLKTINEKLDQHYIKQLRFKHVCIKKNTYKKEQVQTIPQDTIVRLTYEDERVLTRITDTTLRDALRAFRIRCYQEK